MTISIRWYYENDAKRWEKLEAKGNIGPRQQRMLDFWRAAKKKYPTMKSIEVSGNDLYLGEVKDG